MSNIIQAMGSTFVNFTLQGLPPYKRIYIFCNQYEITGVSGSGTSWDESSNYGTPVMTDSQGNAVGFVALISNPLVVIPAGEVRLSFVDNPVSIESSTFLAEATLTAVNDLPYDDSLNIGYVNIRPTIKLRKSNSGEIKDTNPNNRNYLSKTNTIDPLSQVFYVDPNTYPQGLALTSVDLFFISKDNSFPISAEIRPVINGIPSTSDILAGSVVVKQPSEVLVPTSALVGLGPATNFEFEHPVFLTPGEYALTIMTSSSNYVLYTGRFNKNILGDTNNRVVSRIPSVGALFKAQNSSVWTSDNNESLCFRLKKAKFETGSSNVLLQTTSTQTIEFDQILLKSKYFTFGDVATISHKLQTTSTAGAVTGYESVTPNKNYILPARSYANAAGDAKVLITLSTTSKDISPVIDKEKLYFASDKFYVDSVSNRAIVRVDEETHANSTARARYVTKIINLPVVFESSGLQVDVEVNRKTSTDIDIFYRTMSPLDSTVDSDIENISWVRMNLKDNSPRYAGLSDSLFFKETYQALDIKYTRNLVEYTSFTRYQVKVVFYSDTPTAIPKIKNLVVTSVV